MRRRFNFPVLTTPINTLNKWAVGLRDFSDRLSTSENETIPALDSRVEVLETEVEDHETRLLAIETDIGSGNWAAWTPSPSSSAGTGTYTTSNARSALIGKTRHCSLYLRWSQATSAHGSVLITLPSTAKNNGVGQYFASVFTEAASGTLTSFGFIVIPSNGSTATIRRDSSSTITWPIAAGSTNYIVCNFFYEEN